MVNETDQQHRTEVAFSHPDEVSLDENFTLTVEGLPENERVDIVVTTSDGHETAWTIRATYDTGDGRIEMSQQTPVDKDIDGVTEAIQLLSGEIDANYAPPSNESMTVSVEADGRRLGSTDVYRTLGDPDVTPHHIETPDVTGTLFEPAGDGQGPGVVVLHGSGGNPDTLRARTLASHGFVTAAIQYFRGDGLPDHLVDVPIETVERAIDYVLDHKRVSGDTIGLVGTSKGGELALLAGSEFDSVGAVVSINGSGVRWEGIPGGGNPFPGSSWSANGASLAYVPYSKDQSMWEDVMGSFQNPEPPFEYERAYSQSFEEAAESTIGDAMIPVETIDGPVLLVSGGDDRMWDSVGLQQLAYDRLVESDHPYAFEHLVYEDAGHGISVPYQPTANRTVGQQFVMGGSQRGYAEADRNHWPRVIDTLTSLGE